MEVSEGPVSAVKSGSSMPESVVDTIAREPFSGQGKEALKDVAFGSISGIVGKFIEYPFDTVKVRLQSQPDRLPPLYTGPLDCFKQALRRDGFVGLYRGISAPLVGAAVETSGLFFSVRDQRSKSLQFGPPLIWNLVSARSGCPEGNHAPSNSRLIYVGTAVLRCCVWRFHVLASDTNRAC
jgi:hypothetical protein